MIYSLYHCLMTESLHGAVNVVAPNIETMRSFSKKVAKAVHRPLFLRVNEGLLKLILGEMAEEMLLSSENVKPDRLMQSGFHFSYPTLEESLHRSIL